MPRQDPLYAWTAELASALPHLSKPQRRGLAEWSFGMTLARSCSLSTVADYRADYRGQPYHTARQRLRQWYLPARAKAGSRRGDKRRQLDVTGCFAPLLGWLVRDGPGDRLALALDASTLDDRFVVLSVSVLYRGGAVPVAWKVLPATARGAWKPHWLDLLRRLGGAVPADWTVLVLADRGLWAKWLFEGIVALGWHPLLRINRGGTFRPEGWHKSVPLRQLVPQPGTSWRGRGTAFSSPSRQVPATLWAWWGEGHAEPWLILTDLGPQQGGAGWYGLRSWIEQGFKDSKRGGWQWQHTRMTDPERAERLWLAIAVATLWLLRVGGQAEEAEPPGHSPSPAVPEVKLWREPGRPGAQRWRLQSVFARGHRVILIALLKQRRLPLGQWLPEPWPEISGGPGPPTTAALQCNVA